MQFLLLTLDVNITICVVVRCHQGSQSPVGEIVLSYNSQVSRMDWYPLCVPVESGGEAVTINCIKHQKALCATAT